MSKKRNEPEQIVNLLRQIEVEVANGKTCPLPKLQWAQFPKLRSAPLTFLRATGDNARSLRTELFVATGENDLEEDSPRDSIGLNWTVTESEAFSEVFWKAGVPDGI